MRLPHFTLIVVVVLLFCFFPGVAHAGCATSGNQVTCTGGPGASVSASNPNFGNETTSCGPTTFACTTTVSSPSTIAVSGGSGTVSSLTVTVSGYTGVLNTSASPAVTGSRDMGMLLVSPTGKNLELMRCIGHPSSGGQSNLTITFQDGATAMPSCAGTMGFTSGGTFEPSAYHSVANLTDENDPNYSSVITGSLNAPQTNGTSTFASVFTGDNVNGNWTLYLAADPEQATNVSFTSWSITINYTAASTPSTTTLAVTTPSASDPSHVQTGAAYSSGADSSITLTATVAGVGTPTGTVLFQDVSNGGTTNLTCAAGNPAALSGGSASCVTTIGTEGYRSLKASYSGDSTFVASLGTAAVFIQNHSTATGTTYCNSGAVAGDGFSADSSWSPTGSTEHMNPYPSVIFVGDGVNQDITNSVNTVSVTLNNFVVTTANSNATSLLLVSPSGQALEFWNGIGTSVINGTYTIADGNAQMPVSASGTLASGTYEPTAWFSGTFFTPAPPSPAPQVPSPGLISTPQPLGSSTMLSTFAGATAHGPWSLFLYSGEGSNTTTSLGSWCVNITPATGSGTTTSVVASAGVLQTAPLGGNITFTATVSSTSTVNAGTVAFTDTYITSGTTTPLGSAPVSNGTATISTTTLIEGDHLITAAYQGSGSFNDSFGTVRVRVDQTTATPTLNGNTWTYCNTAGITIPARNSPPNDKGAAAPNPSNIFVTNLPGVTESLTLTLNGFHLTNGGNIIESLLVGTVSAAPFVSSYVAFDFFSALSSNEPFGPGNYTFSDLGQSAAVTCSAPFPAVPPTLLAPASCTASTSYVASPSSVLPFPIQHAATAGTSTFNGTFAGVGKYPNGVWSLYFNQTASDTDSGLSSWCLNFTQAAATVSAAESHVGASFTQGQQGVQLTTVVHNVGQGLTGDPTGTNPLTVTDTLPSGLTYANSFSGSGWSCSATGQTVTCTNDSAVLNTAFYPTLTIDVNVSTTAPASVSNTVNVSGAGVTPTTSNTDTITIIPPPSLAATKSHTGTFTQGQTAIWEIFISNVSAGSTTVGTINLADTLPTGYTLNSYFSLGGWTCGSSANVVTCASSPTVQGSGSNFNTVRLIVNVPNASPTSVSNTASVWGGGDPVHNSAATAAVSNTDTVTVVQVPANIGVTSGSGQSANVNTTFANPLVATVTDGAGVAVPNATVTFTAPPQTGPSATFLTNPVTTNASGQASSGIVTANGIAGGPYNVAASVNGLSANFSLRNVGVAAVITSVTSTTANGVYGVGATIPILISFNKAVNVTGTPLVALNSGGTAAYTSGSGTSTLTFAYTVAAGQNSAALDTTSTAALTLNGGTIVDSSGTAAILTLPTPGAAGSLSANSHIVIDTVSPTVVSYSVLWGSASYNVIGTTRNRLPWQITGIQVVFSAPIISGDLNSLSGVAPTGFSGLGTNTLTWTINPINLGNLATTLAGSGVNALKDAAGNALAGGGGFNQNLKVLWGDFNDDGIVNSQDLELVNLARSGAYNIFADMNGDGVVNLADVQIVHQQVGASLP